MLDGINNLIMAFKGRSAMIMCFRKMVFVVVSHTSQGERGTNAREPSTRFLWNSTVSCCSQCGPQTNSMATTQKLCRSADSQASSQSHGTRAHVFASCPGDEHVHRSLGGVAFNTGAHWDHWVSISKISRSGPHPQRF